MKHHYVHHWRRALYKILQMTSPFIYMYDGSFWANSEDHMFATVRHRLVVSSLVQVCIKLIGHYVCLKHDLKLMNSFCLAILYSAFTRIIQA